MTPRTCRCHQGRDNMRFMLSNAIQDQSCFDKLDDACYVGIQCRTCLSIHAGTRACQHKCIPPFTTGAPLHHHAALLRRQRLGGGRQHRGAARAAQRAVAAEARTAACSPGDRVVEGNISIDPGRGMMSATMKFINLTQSKHMVPAARPRGRLRAGRIDPGALGPRTKGRPRCVRALPGGSVGAAGRRSARTRSAGGRGGGLAVFASAAAGRAAAGAWLSGNPGANQVGSQPCRFCCRFDQQ